MKQSFIFCLSIFITASSFAQSLDRQLIGVSNGYTTDSDLQLEWSIGESFIGTFPTDVGLQTEGFIQPQIFLQPTLPEVLEAPMPVVLKATNGLEAFPNPVNDRLTLILKQPDAKPNLIRVLDLTGKTMLTDVFPQGMLRKELNMKDLPFGMYFIQLSTSDGIMKHSIKVLKINE